MNVRFDKRLVVFGVFVVGGCAVAPPVEEEELSTRTARWVNTG